MTLSQAHFPERFVFLSAGGEFEKKKIKQATESYAATKRNSHPRCGYALFFAKIGMMV